jgi:hypothetical protein
MHHQLLLFFDRHDSFSLCVLPTTQPLHAEPLPAQQRLPLCSRAVLSKLLTRGSLICLNTPWRSNNTPQPDPHISQLHIYGYTQLVLHTGMVYWQP